MRELIRPGLFSVARLGLLLSVFAWIIGQFWLMQIGPLQSVDRGIVIVLPPRPTATWMPRVAPHAESRFLNMVFNPQQLAESVSDTFEVHQVPGAAFVVERSAATAYLLAIRHWLIVGLFAVFYATLKCAYLRHSAREESTRND